jgi:hypothetical protein
MFEFERGDEAELILRGLVHNARMDRTAEFKISIPSLYR